MGYELLLSSDRPESPVADEEKSVAKAYLLWLFVGSLGGHNYYLGRPILGLLQFAANAIAILASFTDIWSLTLIFSGGLIVSLLADLVFIPTRVAEHNERLHQRFADRLTWNDD